MNNRLILATAFALATAPAAAFCQSPAATPNPGPDAQQGNQAGPPPQGSFEIRMRRQDGQQGPPPRQFFLAEGPDGMAGPGGMRGEGGMRGDGGDMGRHHEMMGREHEHGDWWKNPELAKRIALTPEQTRKLDEISFQGKLNLIHLHAALQEQELMMKPIVEGPSVDEKKADLQIDKIAEARASLEKAAAKQKFAERAVLTADQWTKLHDHHHMGGLEGPGGPDGMQRHYGKGGPEGGPAPASFAPPAPEAPAAPSAE